MALPDPIPTLTVGAVTYDFARTGMTDTSSTYQTADGLNRMAVSHSRNKRDRCVLRLDRDFVAADPYVSYNNQKYSHSAYVVFDAPLVGVTPAQRDALGQLLTAVMVAGTPDYILRVLQGES